MYKLKNKKSEKVRGITLIALVITIIVLLILAGVSIAMLTGPNGLLAQADEARTETDMAGAREKVQLAILGSYGEDGTLNPVELEKNLQEIPGANVGKQNVQEENLDVEVDGYNFEITKEGEVKDKGTVNQTTDGDEVTPGVIVEGSNKTYTDGIDTAVIPVGFAVSEKEEEQVIDEGLVIKDEAGNEFVWIPVKSAEDYKTNKEYESTIISTATQNDIEYLPLTDTEIGIEEEMQDEEKRQLTLAKEKELVTKEGVKGFYISRYEAGKDDANKLVSKKGVNVLVDMSQENLKIKAKTFDVKDSLKVKSGLCTGIQWDMVMAFVNGKNDGGDPSQEFNVTQYSPSRHKENKARSGQNPADKVCNIYDLEGNYYEYVAEKNTFTSSLPYVNRGGSSDGYYSASTRGNANGEFAFRFVLYIM